MARILAVLPDHPHPADMGSRVRNQRILQALAAEFELVIVSLVHHRELLNAPGPIAELGRWIPVLAPHRRGRGAQIWAHGRARWAALREGLHRETFFQSFPELSRTVEGLVESEQFDLVHVAYWYTLRHLPVFRRPPLWVVDTHDVQFDRQARLWGRSSPREKAAELRELSRYDRVIAITERDRSLLRQHLAESVSCEVIAMGLDLTQWARAAVTPARPAAPRVSFYGNLATAGNQEGARHLLEELLPVLAAEVPDLEGLLLGASPPADLLAAARRAAVPVEVPGFVDDVRPWLASTRVMALTIRSGSGQRGRVIEALALGVPVVGYAEALEGLELSSGEGILIAHEPSEMRVLLRRLLLDPDQAIAVGLAGRSAVSQRYGIDQTYGLFPKLYREILSSSSGG